MFLCAFHCVHTCVCVLWVCVCSDYHSFICHIFLDAAFYVVFCCSPAVFSYPPFTCILFLLLPFCMPPFFLVCSFVFLVFLLFFHFLILFLLNDHLVHLYIHFNFCILFLLPFTLLPFYLLPSFPSPPPLLPPPPGHFQPA